MRFLIDTDWAIAHLRGNHDVSSRIAELVPDGIGISIVSVAELYEGVAHSENPLDDEQKLHRFIDILEIVPLDQPTCKLFGQERARLRANGQLFGDLDLLIGCTAIHHGLVVPPSITD